MRFLKMEGLANDFVVTHELTNDALEALIPNIPRLCDRRRGIGGDGLIAILPSESADYRMRIINADGSEAEMCGNGIRCLVKYLEERELPRSDKLTIETKAGPIGTEMLDEDVRVAMGAPILDAKDIPTTRKTGRVVRMPLDVDGDTYEITAVSMGNPHAVILVDELSDDLVLGVGAKIECHPFFPNRVNVEFLHVVDRSEARMRVYERGCGETMACGTGTCASVVAGILNDVLDHDVTVHLLGGDLRIAWDGNPENSVFMTGSARCVFDGTVDV